MNITYQDAVRALKGLFVKNMLQAVSIYETHLEERPEWGSKGAIAAVFAAGRVDGIRTERAKRRRKGGAVK